MVSKNKFAPREERMKPKVIKKRKNKTISWSDVSLDPSQILLGSEEGGFIGLEEIDASVYDPTQNEFSKLDSKSVTVTNEDNETENDFASGEIPELKKSKKSKNAKKTNSKVSNFPDNDNEKNKESSTVSETKNKKKDPKKKKDKKKVKQDLKDSNKENNQTKILNSKNQNEKSKKGNEYGENEEAVDDKYAHVDVSGWLNLRLNPKIIHAIKILGFKEPTPIQKLCIPAIAHKGKDLVGAAETGSGKTLAFGIPIIQRILDERVKEENSNLKLGQSQPEETKEYGNDTAVKKTKKKSPLRALIITPTRELALQICSHLKLISMHADVRVVAIVGGIALPKQMRLLRLCPEIVVATPGRLWELMSMGEQHLLQLNYLSFFVLDEADRLVQKGHYKELQSIVQWLPRESKISQKGKSQKDKKSQKGGKGQRLKSLDKGDGDEDVKAIGSGVKRKRKGRNLDEEEAEAEDEEEEVEFDNDDNDENADEIEVNEELMEEEEMEEGEEGEEEEKGEEEDEEEGEGEGGGEEEGGEEEEINDINNTKSNTNHFVQMKKRQLLVFSATLAIPPEFRKKLNSKFNSMNKNRKNNNGDDENTMEHIIHQLGMNPNAEVIDLTPSTILAEKVEQAVIECTESDKDMMLYYILRLFNKGRTLVFCTSISSLKRLASLLKMLEAEAYPLHAKMQQRQRLRYLEKFKNSENGILVATDVAARGLDIPRVRTVIHYQLPHSSEIYVHRSGRTARAGLEGLSLAILSPKDVMKYKTLMSNLSKNDGLKKFPVEISYLPQIRNCIALAIQVEGLMHKISKAKAHHGWVKKSKSSLDVSDEDDGEDGENSNSNSNDYSNLSKREMSEIRSLQNQLHTQIQMPLQQMGFSRKYFSKGGLSSLQVQQLQEYKKTKTKSKASPSPSPSIPSSPSTIGNGYGKGLVVIGRLPTEALTALKSSENENKNENRNEMDGEGSKRKSFRNKKKFRYHK